MQSYVWYAGYGSNLNEQRFLCYITGGIPKYGKKSNNGCDDKSLPIKNKALKIPYRLYFAIPNNGSGTENWGEGGVAFISWVKSRAETLARMWKITHEQYSEVRTQEGEGWYNKEILLGYDDEIPIYTITHNKILDNLLPPSEAYMKTIITGLSETYHMSPEKINKYLLSNIEIRRKYNAKYMKKICEPINY